MKKRDPRVKARAVVKDREKSEAAKAEVKRKEGARVAHEAKKAEWQARRTKELLEEEALTGAERGDEWLDADAADGVEDEDDEEVEVFECIACNKYFKSAKQLANHVVSKKHKQRVQHLAKTLEAEDMLVNQEAGVQKLAGCVRLSTPCPPRRDLGCRVPSPPRLRACHF